MAGGRRMGIMNNSMILDQFGKPMVYEQYKGARRSRHRQMALATNSGDEDSVLNSFNLENLREQCLALRRDNSLVAGIASRFADHVVGPQGITPQARTSDPKWNLEAEAFWDEWCKIADFRQRVSLREIQRFVVQSRLFSGDQLTILLANGQIQPIEAGRIKNPAGKGRADGWVNGVKLSKNGIPVAYAVHQRNDRGFLDGNNYEIVKSENAIFSSRPMRIDQVRGIPELAPVVTTLVDFDEMQEANLIKAKNDAFRGWFIASEQGAGAISNLGSRGFDLGEHDEETHFERFAPGMTYYGNPGEQPISLESKTPNSQYASFTKLCLSLIAQCLSIPYQFLMLDFESGSFSSSRAALMTTYRTFAMWQNWLIDTFLQRLWNWRIAKAIKAGDIPPAPISEKNGWSEWWRVAWVTPRYDWIDPKAEAVSDAANVKLGADSVTSIAHRRGQDIDDIMDTRKREILEAARHASEINKELEKLGLNEKVGISSFINVDMTEIPQDEQKE